MRKLWIDTDCASDDGMAILMAMFSTEIDVVGISIVSGYRAASKVWKNPFIFCEKANVAPPPIFMGSDVPFGFRYVLPEVHVHGEDGMGDLNCPLPAGSVIGNKHAAIALLDSINANPGEIEIITLGPLTNLALAFRLDPNAYKKIKKLWIMGGTGRAVGNISPVAEANIGGDPEASQVVFTSGVKFELITLEASGGSMFYSTDDIAALVKLGKTGRFLIDTSHDMISFLTAAGIPGLIMADPAAMGYALWLDLEITGADVYCEVEHKEGLTYGMVVEDATGMRPSNCHAVYKMNGDLFKERVCQLFNGR